jgi:succinylarginine dihydrolase
LASAANQGAAANPRAAALEGLAKMRLLADLGVPQFVLPPHERPDVSFLRALGYGGRDADVLRSVWTEAPVIAGAAASASAMWAANAATVTPSADSGDRRVHLSPANLVSNLHRSLEPPQTAHLLRMLLPDESRFAVHDALPSVPHFGDEGAANHVRLCASQGDAGVNLFVYGREAFEAWPGRHPARQTLEASQAVARRHGAARAVFARQSRTAIDAGAFHNDVVCVGTRTCLFHHEQAFEDTTAVHDAVRRAAGDLFEPVFVVVPGADLPLNDAIGSYLFNSQLIEVPGEDRLVLVAPMEVRENARARTVAEGLVAGNGPIGRVLYVDVRQSMRNGGGPACLRLRLVLTAEERRAVNPGQVFDAPLHARLEAWVNAHYRDRLAPEDLADAALLQESRAALDALTRILGLRGDVYPFQQT